MADEFTLGDDYAFTEVDALGIFGAVMQSYGAFQAGKAKSYVMDYNADVAAADAEMAVKSKKVSLHKHRTMARKLLARQNAIVASSGRGYSGSPLDVIARSEAEAELDESILILNANMKIGRFRGESAVARGGASAALHFGRAKAAAGLAMSSAKVGLGQRDRAKSKT